jgi:hypothetical protein
MTRALHGLLEAGSDVHWHNRQGETALYLAMKSSRRTAAKFLLAFGADIHVWTSCGLDVLGLGHKYSLNCKLDENFCLPQIMPCMSLAASCGAASEPTILERGGNP